MLVCFLWIFYHVWESGFNDFVVTFRVLSFHVLVIVRFLFASCFIQVSHGNVLPADRLSTSALSEVLSSQLCHAELVSVNVRNRAGAWLPEGHWQWISSPSKGAAEWFVWAYPPPDAWNWQECKSNFLFATFFK